MSYAQPSRWQSIALPSDDSNGVDTQWLGGLVPDVRGLPGTPPSERPVPGFPEPPEWTVYARYADPLRAVSPNTSQRLDYAPAEVRVEWGAAGGRFSFTERVHALGSCWHVVGPHLRVSARRAADAAYPAAILEPGQLTARPDVEVMLVPGRPSPFIETVEWVNSSASDQGDVTRPLPAYARRMNLTQSSFGNFNILRPDGSSVGVIDLRIKLGIPTVCTQVSRTLFAGQLFPFAVEGVR